jgi:ataxin-10
VMALKKHINAVAELFDGLTGPEKRALLDVLHEWPEDETIGLDAVSLVSKLFKEQSTTLLTTFKAGESADPALTMKLLELICEWTANEDDHQKQIQDDTSVLIDAVYMLKMVHQLGTEGKEKEYEPVRKISQLDCAFILTNPVFGFKRDLVRLIGNLCWRHKKNQETVRDIDGIPLLLDCSPIDANNPFMLQWVVFAMRNLCEDNADNQKVLEGIDKEGTMTAEMAKAAEVTIKRSHKKKIAQPEQTAEDEKMQEGEEVDAGKTADAVNSGGAEGDNNGTAGTPAS